MSAARRFRAPGVVCAPLGAVVVFWAASYVVVAGGATLGAQARTGLPVPTIGPESTGAEIFGAACATCHGADGTGSPAGVVGFALPLPNGHGFPDFTDCPTNTVEPAGDWMAVVHSGGPVRGLDRHMPAFGDALSDDQIARVVKHLWTFCRDRSWPRGDLNLPRGLFTEKAFPENETLFLTGSRPGLGGATETVVYERRFGSRGTWELAVPLSFGQVEAGGPWRRGLGDVELTVRQTVHADYDRGRIVAVGGSVLLPTGKEALGLGNGFTVFEPLLLAGQMLGANGFVQVQTGVEVPTDHQRGANEGFVRVNTGYTWAQSGGLGRAWTPMVELLSAKPSGGSAEWDVVPQVQVSLSKLQHVLFNVGVRLPLNERTERKPQVMTYLLWDWFDGGLFQFWK